ncbi:MAG: hypothetical protein V2A78_01790 [bacterium]
MEQVSSWREKLVELLRKEAARNNLFLKLGVPPALANMTSSQVSLEINHLLKENSIPAECQVDKGGEIIRITIDPSWAEVRKAPEVTAENGKENRSLIKSFLGLFKKR